jgi:hypothetical protein
MTHAVAYFSFGSANPDGTEHLQNRGNNIFCFEDLPYNLGISDFGSSLSCVRKCIICYAEAGGAVCVSTWMNYWICRK